MVQYIEHPLAPNEGPGEIGMAPQSRHRMDIARIRAGGDHQQVFVEGHLSRPPQGRHRLADMTRIAGRESRHGNVVRHTRRRHVEIGQVGLHGKAHRSEKNRLGRLGDIEIFLGRNSHHRSGPYGSLPVGNGRHVKEWIAVLERIESRMVAERSLHRLLLGGINVPLDDEVAVVRHPQFVGQAAHQPHGPASQEPRQQVFVDAVGQRSRRRIGIDRIAAQTDAHGHPAPGTPPGFVVTRTGLVHVPVHARRLTVEKLHAVHAHIGDSRLGVDRMHHRQRHEAPAVARPALQYGQPTQIGLGSPPHGLLTGSAPPHPFRKPARRPSQQRQRPQLLAQRAFRSRRLAQQGADGGGNIAEPLHPQRQRHAPVGTEQVHQHGKLGSRPFEQQGPATARRLGHAVGNLGHLQHRIDRRGNAHQFSFAVEPVNVFLQTCVHDFSQLFPYFDKDRH